jgi:FAD/FMN-containing dehydrogenase
METDMTEKQKSEDGFSRRALMGRVAGVAAAVSVAQWTPAFRVPAASAASTLATPPNFPPGISLYQQAFKNWAGEIAFDAAWTCAPASPADVVTLANWAHANGWRIRAKGYGHNWSPLLVPNGGDANALLVDTAQHLTAVTVHSGSPASVTAQAGVSMDALLATLESSGYGMTACPAPGDLTLGGVLAIGGHGTAVPAPGETLTAGHTFGSVTNLVLSLTAVVWDGGSGQYVLKTFSRSDPDIRAFLVHLGRAFVTEATLRTGPNKRLRCQSSYTIQANDMFAPPASAGSNSFARLVDGSGRVEAIWFPFTTVPWLKVWSVSPGKPWFSKENDSPYPFTFADTVAQSTSDTLAQIFAGDPGLTPTLENGEMGIVGSGLITTGTWDIWGWSKNSLHYVKPTTLKVTANGYVILTARANIQRVVSEFYAYYTQAIAAYQSRGQYPMNGPLEIRVTGLDNPADCGVPGAVSAELSPLKPRPDHPEWDVAVWLDILTVPGTPSSEQFYKETEAWVLGNYTGSYAALRAEWSKGWGYDGTSAWANPAVLGTVIPNSYRTGQAAGDTWDTAVATLNAYDPGHVFGNTFLDTLLV